MDAGAESIRFLMKEQKLEIPFFQRPYVWKYENAKNLLDDLIRYDGKHFIGSILIKRTINNNKEPYKGLIIDGQQRITTLSILIKVIYEILIEKGSIDTNQTDDIVKFLFYLESDDNSYKVRLTNSFLDIPNYRSIIGEVEKTQIKGFTLLTISSPLKECVLEEINSETEFSEGKNEEKYEERYNSDDNLLKQCYKYYNKRLREMDVESILKLFNKLFDNNNKILVVIGIDTNEQEQEIFDTINSSGMHLSSTDIIKNHLFDNYRKFNLKEEEIYNKYKKTWLETFENDESTNKFWTTEKNVGRNKRDNMELLFQGIGIIKGIYNVEKDTLSELAKKYKEYIDSELSSTDAVDNFIEEIMDYADIYKNAIPTFSNTKHYTFNDTKERLACVMAKSENTTFTPYILYLYKRYNDDPKKLKEKLNAVDTILMHYIISGKSKRNFNKYCPILIDRDKEGEDSLKEYIKSELDNFEELEILNGLKKKNNEEGKLILFWIELYNKSKKEKSLEPKVAIQFAKEIELEHILPQKWYSNKDWLNTPYVDEQGNIIEDSKIGEKERNNKVYSLGNMTILETGLNKRIKNDCFYKKIQGDTKNPGIRANAGTFSIISDFIPNEDTKEEDYIWNEQTISEREKKLGEQILTIWPIIK